MRISIASDDPSSTKSLLIRCAPRPGYAGTPPRCRAPRKAGHHQQLQLWAGRPQAPSLPHRPHRKPPRPTRRGRTARSAPARGTRLRRACAPPHPAAPRAAAEPARRPVAAARPTTRRTRCCGCRHGRWPARNPNRRRHRWRPKQSWRSARPQSAERRSMPRRTSAPARMSGGRFSSRAEDPGWAAALAAGRRGRADQRHCGAAPS